MTPIEAAARALAKQQSGTDDFDALDEGLQETLKAEVRAVLEAVRVPSSGMVKAGQQEVVMALHRDGGYKMEGVWTAMIKAAMAECS